MPSTIFFASHFQNESEQIPIKFNLSMTTWRKYGTNRARLNNFFPLYRNIYLLSTWTQKSGMKRKTLESIEMLEAMNFDNKILSHKWLFDTDLRHNNDGVNRMEISRVKQSVKLSNTFSPLAIVPSCAYPSQIKGTHSAYSSNLNAKTPNKLNMPHCDLHECCSQLDECT